MLPGYNAEAGGGRGASVHERRRRGGGGGGGGGREITPSDGDSGGCENSRTAVMPPGVTAAQRAAPRNLQKRQQAQPALTAAAKGSPSAARVIAGSCDGVRVPHPTAGCRPQLLSSTAGLLAMDACCGIVVS